MTSEVSAFDLSQLAWINGHIFLEETDSTNTYALNNISSIIEQSPYLIVAKTQTAGRGRGQNQWLSDRGNLTCSLVISQNSIQPEQKRMLALLSALAIGQGIEQTLGSGPEVQYKWPNDIYYRGKKLAGILIESKNNCYVIGIGINVNQHAANLPGSINERAISMITILGCQIEFSVLLNNLLSAFECLLEQTDANIVSLWQSKSLLQDCIVRISTPAGEVQGRCLGINQQGHLIVMTTKGVEEIVAGSILSYE